jgi:hypothetical protein
MAALAAAERGEHYTLFSESRAAPKYRVDLRELEQRLAPKRIHLRKRGL